MHNSTYWNKSVLYNKIIITNTFQKLNKQRSDINEHEEKLREIESFEKLKVNVFQNFKAIINDLISLQDELVNFEIIYAWLSVTQKENLLKETDEKLEKYQKKENEFLQAIQNKDQVNLRINQEIR